MSHPYANPPYNGNPWLAPPPPPNGGLAPGMHYLPIGMLPPGIPPPSTQMFRPPQSSGQPTSGPPTFAPPGSAPPIFAPPGSAPPGSAPPGSAPPGSAPPSSYRNEPSGARLHGQAFEVDGVRVLFPLSQAVFHVMDEKFVARVPGAQLQAYLYFTGLTVTDFFESLGVKRGVTEWLETGNGNEPVKAQTIMVGDTRADKKLQEVGWHAGRGVTSKPIWIQIL
ncbi:MAG: hypothetical protein Q9221_003993 [Calogaya cf. arnoldii]